MKRSHKKQKKGDRILDNVVIDHSLQSTNVKSIIKAMLTSGGFQSTNLAFGVEILRRMRSEKRCTKFLSFVSASECIDAKPTRAVQCTISSFFTRGLHIRTGNDARPGWMWQEERGRSPCATRCRYRGGSPGRCSDFQRMDIPA